MQSDAEQIATLQAENEALRQENRQLLQRIAELEQTEKAHRDDKEYLNMILCDIPVMIDTVDSSGQITFWNRECERVTGYSAHEIIRNPRAVELLYPDPEYRSWILKEWASHVEAGLDWELELSAKDGTTRTVVWRHVAPSYTVSGASSWYIAIDVTRLKHQERKLRQSQVLLQGIIDNSPMAILVKDINGHYVLNNDYAAALVNSTREHLLGKTDDDLFPSDVAEETQEIDREIITTGQIDQSEQTIMCDDGLHTFLKIKFPIYDDQSHVYAIGNFMTDITDRKHAEDRLNEVQQMLRLVINNLPQAIFWKDRNLNYLGCNTQFAHVAGLESPDEVVGKSDHDMPWAEHAHLYPQDDQEVMLNNTPKYNFEEPIKRADGSYGWIITSKIPLHDSNGNVIAVLGMFEDITGRKQAEEDLLTFKAVAENASDGLSFVSIEGVITYANQAMKTMMGYGDELVGSPVDIVFGGDAEQPRQIIRHVIEHGNWQGPLGYYQKDGSIIQIHLSVFVIRDASGRPVLFPGFVRDLTEFNQAEAERAALQQQLINAQQATISELSAPLLPLSNDIVALPLIGTIDSNRAQNIMETLLEGIATYQSSIAIVDITGVKVVDTQVAQAIIRTAQAVKLLGAQVVLTGIQPQIAQTLVHLGTDLTGIVTHGTFQAGISYALDHASHQVRSNGTLQ